MTGENLRVEKYDLELILLVEIVALQNGAVFYVKFGEALLGEIAEVIIGIGRNDYSAFSVVDFDICKGTKDNHN